MSQSNIIWLEQPASDWNEALPIGNGRLGAMVFGNVQRERLQLNEDTLWSGEPVQAADPDMKTYLAEIRRLVFTRQYHEATEACRKLQGAYSQSYLPLGDLWLEFGHGDTADDYRRELDLDMATVQISYRVGDVTYHRSFFVSAPDQALVIRLTASQPGSLSLSASLTSPLRSGTASDGPDTLHLSGRAPAHVEPPYRDVEPAIVYDDAEDGKGMRFSALVRAVAEGGSVQSDSSALTIAGADSVTLYVTAATNFSGFNQSPSQGGKDQYALARKAMDEVTVRAIGTVYDDHLADYRRYFRRVQLDLGDSPASNLPTDKRLKALQTQGPDNALTALYFQYGRYLLISSSRPGTQPANLQGIWNYEVRPPWSCNYTLNINAQMNYWPAETANLAELSEPLFGLIDALRVTGRDAAQAYYGASGWCAHHNTDQWAMANPVGAGTGQPSWANWPMGGAWLVQHLWEHYAFSGDRAFLSERAYPALRGAAEFLLDFLVESPDGTLVTCPSTSPENEFVYTAPDGSRAEAMVTAGTTMDLAITREVFQNTREVGPAARHRRRVCRARLPPPWIACRRSESASMASCENGRPMRRNWTPATAISATCTRTIPACLITKTKTPELAQAALASLDRRVAHGGGYTGWSRAWLLNQYARLGEGEKAHHSLHVLLAESTYPNLLDAHPPFQIDGNFGGASGIAEMLLHSHDDAIDLLPALPAAWPEGHVSGLRARGGFEVSLEWAQGRLVSAVLMPKLAAACTVRYGGHSVSLDCRPGEIVSLNARLEHDSA